jgi:hypothetical protein
MGAGMTRGPTTAGLDRAQHWPEAHPSARHYDSGTVLM